jgi:predicted nucleotidyltransferase
MESAALSVPPISGRIRIPTEAIDDVVSQIVSHFQPDRIILFGSYAYGQPRPESDVDLLVVMHISQTSISQAAQILRTIHYRFGLDILVYTPETLAQRLSWGDPFLAEITRQGKLLYESSRA